VLFRSGRTARLAGATLSSALIGATLTWWLVGRFGTTGAAAGFAATQGLLALLTTATAMRTFVLPWCEIGPAFAAWRQASFARQQPRPAANTLEPRNTAP
jgi:O-antigen/teichoic acid export membrane protein